MESKEVAYYEANLFLGSREKYNGESFTRDELSKAIGRFQNDCQFGLIPVRISSCQYRTGDYNEEGWEVSIFNYPRHPRPFPELNCFIHSLAKHLLTEFRQNRISVITPGEIHMYENPEAVERHDE